MIQQELGITTDSIPGKGTLQAVARKLGTLESWEAVQKFVGAAADGIPGVETAKKIIQKLGFKMDNKTPRQSEVESFYGAPGENLTTITLPYEMKLAWELKTKVNKMTINKKVASAVERIFTRTLDYYGFEKIQQLGLDLNGGAYNRRRIIGGQGWSMHAYGIAIDIDPEHNQLKWGRDKARLAKPEYEPFWNIVESEGAFSLGKERNYDWMHFQFARL